jgi:hypothetical protein
MTILTPPVSSTSYVADADVRIKALRFADRSPILSVSLRAGQTFTLSLLPHVRPEQTEAFADQLVIEALAFAEAAKEHAAHVRQEQAYLTYLSNIVDGEVR